MWFRYSLRTLALAIVVIAIALAALVHPSTTMAGIVVNGVLLAILVAFCLILATPQPHRSFWLGFAVACLWTLALDELGQRGMIKPFVFTDKLASIAKGVMPPAELRGEPGSKLYFRTDEGRLRYYGLGDNGKIISIGSASLERLERQGDLDALGPIEDLPHVDSIPNSTNWSKIFRYLLALLVGTLGGMLTYGIRCRRFAGQDPARQA